MGNSTLSVYPTIDVSFVQIEPTTRCNFTCGFCAGRHMPQVNMRLETLEEILRAVGEARGAGRGARGEGENAGDRTSEVGDQRSEVRSSLQSQFRTHDSRCASPSPRPSPLKGEGEEGLNSSLAASSASPSTRHSPPDTRHSSLDTCHSPPGLRHVELQGEGEPMLHPQFFAMAEMIRRMHPAAKISLISNGSLLSEANVARILEIGFHKISVSIESPDEQAFAEIRGGKLEKVAEGVRRLVAARSQRNASPSPRPSPFEGEGERTRRHSEGACYVPPAVGFAVTVLRRTMHELPWIVELYQRLGLDGGITVQPLQTMRSYTQHYGPEMRAQMLTPIDRWHLSEQLQHHPRLRAFFSRRPAVSGFYDELFAGSDPASGECPWLSRGLYVAYNGQTTGCCFIKDTARDGFGELTPATADQVTERREAMQDELRAGRIPGPCNGCPVAQRITASRRTEVSGAV